MKKLVVMMAVVSAIATIIDVSDASAQSWGRRGANVRCTNGGVVQESGTAISKTHQPDHGTITAPGGVTNCGPAWKADELSAAWCSRFRQPNYAC
jgi:hypothetical protein